jgi:PAS domain S-box-containing protein
MSQADISPKFADYYTVGQAAEFLGVSTATLRNWDRSGKLKPRRHPQNGYRIYLHEDLQELLESVGEGQISTSASAPSIDWSEMGEQEHFVQFYENDDFLVESVSQYVCAALIDGHAAVVIATEPHRACLELRLAARGIDTADAMANDRLVILDAGETLDRFMVNGSPSPTRFMETVGTLIGRLTKRFARIHAFGEMVALLWADGNRDAAIGLEELWNELGKRYRFSLFCAYPIAGFDQALDAGPLEGVCTCHSRVIPAESYVTIADSGDRLREITSLQQKAMSLQAEIAHRQQVERALGQREKELADFFENAAEGMHKVGPDGDILWANKAEYQLLGYSAEEYVGHSISEFHVDRDVINDMLDRLRRGETLENYPARLRCKNGSIKHVLVNSSGCFHDGQFSYTRCFTRDVTRLWHAEQALREADRRKDEFLATLAHELRNPLAPIGNSIQTLKIQGFDEDAVNIMQRQLDQLTRLVDDLLDVSRITRNKVELRKQQVELEPIIRSAVETSRPLIDASGHQLKLRFAAQPLALLADSARLAQVFSNLINNSAKYTPRGGTIELTVEKKGDEAIVRVRDNGIGISCEDLPHVFDMFRQLDHSLEKSQGGLGIGLSLVRRLVELHGGTVNAHSEGTGKGSEFVVTLPIATTAPKVTPQRKLENRTAVSRLRILVVDDNKDSGETLAKLLGFKGHETRTAYDGLEAIDVAEKFLPDIILMDVGMPRLNGYETTRRIRQTPWGQQPKIVALTGWGQAEDVRKSVEAGCSAHLIKPVDFAALERLLAGAKNAPPVAG